MQKFDEMYAALPGAIATQSQGQSQGGGQSQSQSQGGVVREHYQAYAQWLARARRLALRRRCSPNTSRDGAAASRTAGSTPSTVNASSHAASPGSAADRSMPVTPIWENPSGCAHRCSSCSSCRPSGR